MKDSVAIRLSSCDHGRTVIASICATYMQSLSLFHLKDFALAVVPSLLHHHFFSQLDHYNQHKNATAPILYFFLQ